MVYNLQHAWALSDPRATRGLPSTLILPARIFQVDKPLKMPLKMLLFKKNDCKEPIFSLKSNKLGPYGTYTGPHRPFLFPMWPAIQKELPTPALHHAWATSGPRGTRGPPSTLKWPVNKSAIQKELQSPGLQNTKLWLIIGSYLGCNSSIL